MKPLTMEQAVKIMKTGDTKALNRFAIYNTYAEELEGTNTFETVEEANKFMSDHWIGRTLDGKQLDSFIVIELKRV